MSHLDPSRSAPTGAAVVLLFALFCALPGSALAEDPEPAAAPAPMAEAEVETSNVASDEQVSAVYGAKPSEDPDRYPELDTPTKPWRYDNRYLFQLTRGLGDLGLATWERVTCMVGTVPVDVVVLPVAAVAGLFGS